ncbi:MAG: hypothetical protein GY870_13195, partial [archaeon]|nr:hypothetical protein [archaeon]
MIEKGDPENMAQSSGEIKIKEEYDSKKMAGRIEQLIGVRREEFYGAIREYEKEVESYDEAKIKERIKEIETNIPEWRRENFKREKKELEYNLTKKGLNTTREAFKIILFNFVIEQIINDLNAERIIKIIDELKIARIMDVEDNAEDNRKNAINSLMEGRLTYICPFAGMGSRMLNALKKIHGKVSYNQKKNYKIANINPWHLAKEVGEKIFERIKLAEDPSERLGKLIRDLEAIDENGKHFKKCAPLLVEAIMKSMGFIIPKGED